MFSTRAIRTRTATIRFSGIRADEIDQILKVLSAAFLEKDISEMEQASQFFLTSALEIGAAVVSRAIEISEPTLTAAAEFYYAGGWANDTEFCESMPCSRISCVAETASKYQRIDPEVRSSIIGSFTRFLSIFRSPDVARATLTTTFSIAKLRAQTATLYLVVREGDQAALSPLLRMIVTRLLDDATDRVPSEDEQTILAMIDEFPLLKAPVIKSKLATLRKYRVRPVLLAQSATQIKDFYGSNETITGLCDVWVIFPTLDESTQDIASRTCGDETVMGPSRSAGPDQKRTFREVGRRFCLRRPW